MSDNFEYAKNQGYEAPFRKSPIEVPNGWSGGSVEDIGGGNLVRRWTNFTWDKKKDGDALEVIYNVSQDDHVNLNKYKWNGENYMKDHLVESFDAKEKTDTEQAKVAKKIMNTATHFTEDG